MTVIHKKTSLLFLLIGLHIATLGQTFRIQYDFFQYPNDNFYGFVERHSLTLTPIASECKMLDRKYLKQFSESQKSESNGITIERLGDKNRSNAAAKPKLFFKDYTSNMLLSNQFVGREQHIIKENLDLMVWEISDKDTLFFEKRCKIAITKHRGQKWTVFFTDAFGAMGGPWKFDGLPGLVLYAQNESKDYIFQATQLEYEKDTYPLVNPFAGLASVSWHDYTISSKNYAVKKLKQIKTANVSDPTTLGKNEKISTRFTFPPIEDLGYDELSH